MLYIILLAIATVAGLYLAPSETKGTYIWFGRGLRGAAQDAKAIRTASLERALLDPELVETTAKALDDTLINTTVYHRNATARNLTAEKSYKAKQAELAAAMNA